ncbi:fructose-bisphosphatase class II family protein [Varunaivibrio sulfuroxidans]|uniref:Fructose-1,6-bisphosphatase n=1 Tax=Varunaivibrio sulfuroxidans TaxID=1773489 RepID=A0A4V2UP26_9PROT|nr:fructose-bisphosphatase class II [Varunaivibrio sulfuroxidans]TCS64271.1 fructose-1,6-bisphosphatase II [Varunaivibrio sulfuroxidans]WES31291.1 fructose-bisphosphatase class II [Varunaivibrio sulfuroxidans]
MSDASIEDPLFVYALRNATEAAARAAYDWIGRGDRGRGDRGAISAMRGELDKLPVHGRIVVGESNPEDSGLSVGEVIGGGTVAMRFDIAADPIEGMSYLARGMTNAMAVIALTVEGAMFDPGPAFYMEKFAAPPAARGKIDPAAPLEEKLKNLANALDKPIDELTIFVLEKPRHRNLVERIHNAGARVALYPAGDVAGALMAAMPNSGIDALMGCGGAREGLLSACAIRALGGEFMARLDPQLATEKAEVAKAGMNTASWMALETLIRSPQVYFCATGITTGLLFEGIVRRPDHEQTQTLLISGSGERQVLTTFHRTRGSLPRYDGDDKNAV